MLWTFPRVWRGLSPCCAAAALLCAGPAIGQDRVLRIVVPFPPGGGADAAARALSKRLQSETGERVLIENKPGAGGNIAAEQVAQSTPDGSALLLSTNSVVINPLIYNKLRYSAKQSFAPVALVARSPLLILASTDAPFKSLREMLLAVRAQPGKFSYASCGNGSIHHLAAEQMKLQAGLDLVHVPYKGCAPAMVDLAGGQVQVGVISLTTAAPYVASGKVRVLAVAQDEPSPLAAQLPTAAQEGLPRYRFDGWYALLAPAGTPKARLDQLNAAVTKALADGEVRQALAAGHMEPAGGPPAVLAALIDHENALYQPIVKAGQVKGD